MLHGPQIARRRWPRCVHLRAAPRGDLESQQLFDGQFQQLIQGAAVSRSRSSRYQRESARPQKLAPGPPRKGPASKAAKRLRRHGSERVVGVDADAATVLLQGVLPVVGGGGLRILLVEHIIGGERKFEPPG